MNVEICHLQFCNLRFKVWNFLKQFRLWVKHRCTPHFKQKTWVFCPQFSFLHLVEFFLLSKFGKWFTASYRISFKGFFSFFLHVFASRYPPGVCNSPLFLCWVGSPTRETIFSAGELVEGIKWMVPGINFSLWSDGTILSCFFFFAINKKNIATNQRVRMIYLFKTEMFASLDRRFCIKSVLLDRNEMWFFPNWNSPRRKPIDNKSFVWNIFGLEQRW